MASVLIIEDVAAVLFSLRIVLEAAGHRITTAQNGTRGLELIKSRELIKGGSFDLVITDIWMPGLSGTEVIRLGRECSPATRFLAVTGGDPKAGEPPGVLHGQNFGADRVLLKPFDIDDLEGAVAALLAVEPGRAHPERNAT